MLNKLPDLNGLSATFVRGAIATGIVAAVQDQRSGQDLLKSALLGGAALSTAVSIEQLLFNPEGTMPKKKKKGKIKDVPAAEKVDLAALQAFLQQQQAPSGMLGNLTPGQQLLAGLVLGAALAWVLGDEQMRAKLLRYGLQLYGTAAAGVEELKEQAADIQAELAAQQMSRP